MAVSTVYAGGVPTHNKFGYEEMVKQLGKLTEEIQKWSKTIGTVKTQINKLNEVSSTIRSLKSIAAGGVRGIAGELAEATGLTQVLGPMRDITDAASGAYRDANSLVAEIRSLPDLAKQRLEEIGMSVTDMKDFLRSGIYYDTFYKMGAEQWQAVASNPWRALKDGSFGRACAESDEFLSVSARAEMYSSYVAGLSPEEMARMRGVMGPELAMFMAGEWFVDMKKRTTRVLDFREVGEKLSKAIEPSLKVKPSSSPSEEEPDDGTTPVDQGAIDRGLKALTDHSDKTAEAPVLSTDPNGSSSAGAQVGGLFASDSSAEAGLDVPAREKQDGEKAITGDMVTAQAVDAWNAKIRAASTRDRTYGDRNVIQLQAERMLTQRDTSKLKEQNDTADATVSGGASE